MIRKGGHHMIFPDSYGRDQYSPAEEARQEAEQAAAEREQGCARCGESTNGQPGYPGCTDPSCPCA